MVGRAAAPAASFSTDASRGQVTAGTQLESVFDAALSPCTACSGGRGKGKDTTLCLLGFSDHVQSPQLFCPQCPLPADQLIVRIQRCMQHAAVRLEDISQVWSVLDVQHYPGKGHHIMYLRSRLPQTTRPIKLNPLFGSQCQTCAAALTEPRFSYCSLKCKADAHGLEQQPAGSAAVAEHMLPPRHSKVVSEECQWPALTAEDSVLSSCTAEAHPGFEQHVSMDAVEVSGQQRGSGAGWMHAVYALLHAADHSQRHTASKVPPPPARHRSTRSGAALGAGPELPSVVLKTKAAPRKRGRVVTVSARKHCPHRAALE